MPAKNKLDDLRNHLFETLEALKDEDKPMDLDRARAVADVARVIVESAKVEVNFLKVTGAARSTSFLPAGDEVVAPVGRRLSATTNRRVTLAETSAKGKHAPGRASLDDDLEPVWNGAMKTPLTEGRGLGSSLSPGPGFLVKG